MKARGFVSLKAERVGLRLKYANRSIEFYEEQLKTYQKMIKKLQLRIEHKKRLAAKYRDILTGLEVRSACEKPLKRWKDEPKPQTPELPF